MHQAQSVAWDASLFTKRHVRNSTPPRIHSSPQKTKYLHSMNSHTPEVQCGAMRVECTYTFTFNKLHVLTLLKSPGARKRAHDGGLASSSPSCGRRAERRKEGTNLVKFPLPLVHTRLHYYTTTLLHYSSPLVPAPVYCKHRPGRLLCVRTYVLTESGCLTRASSWLTLEVEEEESSSCSITTSSPSGSEPLRSVRAFLFMAEL